MADSRDAPERPLTVLNVAFPLAPVRPDAVGGAEAVVSHVDRALVEAGHRSVVIAVEGSEIRGTHVAIPAPGRVLDHAAWLRAHDAQRRAIARALAEWPVDVVHLHGLDFDLYLPPPGPPALVTLHLPPDVYRAAALRPPRPLTFLAPVSRSQRALFPAGTALLDPIPNGVPLERFRPALRKHGYALAIGRITEQKGTDLAIAAARQAGVPLVLAGAVMDFPDHVGFFEERVRPHLGGREVAFAGPVAGARKRRLLAGARCVVVASRVPETCSLVALEALASGTPVVAFRRGALPDVLEEGRTGLLADSVEELGEAIRAAGSLSPAACREAAEARFGAREMTDRYLAAYRRLARLARPAREREPSAPRRGERPAGDGAPARAPAGAPFAARGEDRVETITSFDRLEAVRGPWEELWRRALAATPFTSPAWLLPWCRHLATAPPWAFAVWRGHDLVALAPTFRWDTADGPVLGLLGGGVSDYQDAIAARPEDLAPVLALLRDRAGGAFARAELRALPDRSPFLLAEVPPRLVAEARPDDVCPVLPLPLSAGALAERASAKLLADVRYRLRKLRRAGPVELDRAGPDELPATLAELFRLHRARWETRGGPGVLDGARLAWFHADAAAALARAGLLRLRALRAGGRTLAVLLGFSAHGRAYAYAHGLAPDAAPYSPGSLLFLHAIEEAVDEGALELDFLRGREPYKYRWGAEDRPTLRLALAPADAARAAAGAGAGAARSGVTPT